MFSRLHGIELDGSAFRIKCCEMGMPGLGQTGAGLNAAGGNGGLGPLPIGQVHQRQVEQPFAGIIHDIDVELSAAEIPRDEAVRLIFQGEAKLADAARAFRPGPVIGGEACEMVFIGKAGQVIIGLRFEIGPGDAALGIGFEHGQAASLGEGMNQGGDENGFARS